MADILVQFVFGAGLRLLDLCQEAKQCEVEVVRIAVRTQNVLGTLKDASEHFDKGTGLQASLIELKSVFESIHALVGRCGLPESIVKRASMAVMKRGNPNRAALINAEKSLERITQDLGLPMLSDIKNQLNQMQSQSMASSGRDAEAIAEVVRNEIRRAMMVRGTTGLTIQDTIDEKMSGLARDDRPGREHADDDRGSSGQAPCAGGKTGKRNKAAGGLMMTLGRVNSADLEEGEVLGEGTFGTVVSGTYRGRDVAVKKARGALGSSPIMEAFRQEAEIHFAMRHANIVQVVAFGLGDAEHPPCLVMERMQESLFDLLGVEGIEIDPAAKVSITHDVCEGLRFLHDHRIVHRDLKSLNVLLDAGWTAKISDFGLAKVNSTVAASTGGGGYHNKVGSDFWMSPEVHSNCKATRASDVFSLHVVMWEIFAQERVGHGKPIGERLQSNPEAKLPPLGCTGCSEAVASNVRNVVDRCGYGDPSDRPKMTEVCSVMSRVMSHIENAEENPLDVVAPAPRPQRQHQQEASSTAAGAAAVALKGSPSTGTKDDYDDPHRTLATVAMSTTSSGGSRPFRPLPVLPPGKKASSTGGPPYRAGPMPAARAAASDARGFTSMGSGVHHSSQDSRGPAPPLPRRPPSASTSGHLRPPTNAAGGSAKRDDRAVLVTLMYKCAPPPAAANTSANCGWGISTGWGVSTASLGSWYGVRTLHEDASGFGGERVTGLTLPGNGLLDQLPEELCALDYLTELDLKDNLLTGALPRELGNLTALTSLNLRHNNLSGDIPETLGNLYNLETLDLSNNEMSGRIPKQLANLRALRVLRLSVNRLIGEIPHTLRELDRLEELDLGSNNITGAIWVGDWPALRILDLSANGLEGWISPDLLDLAESLTILRLSRNFNLSGGIPIWLGSMKYLEEVDLSATHLGGEIPTELGELSRLSMLMLGSCRLVGSIPSELGRLRYLKHLALSDNNLTGPIPQAVLQLPALRYLNLANNSLQVSKARIGGTKAAIKKTLPKGCNIKL